MKKVWGVLLAVIMCFAVMTGCKSNKGGGTTVDDEGNIVVTELTMWAGGQWIGSDYTNLEKFITAYNAKKPDGFTINLQKKTDLETSMATGIRQGKQPDMLIWDRFNTPTYSTEDYLTPVEDFIAADKVDTSVYHPEAMKEMIYGGHTYGLPLDLDTWGVYVNLDKVKEYNDAHADSAIETKADGTLDTDWTWDDLLDMAKKLKTVCAAGYSSGDQEEHLFKYAVSAGADIVKDGKANFNTDQVRDILTFFSKVKAANVGGNQEKGAFPAGNIAMINNPTYYSSYIAEKAPNLNFQFMPQPRYSVNGIVQEGAVNGGMIGGYGIAYPKPTKKYTTDEWRAKHKAAWTFTKWWLTDKDNLLEWSKVSGTLPAMTTLYNEQQILENPVLKSASEFVAQYKIRPQVPGYLQLQTNVINTKVKLYLEGTASLDTTISQLNSAGNMELN